MPPKASFEPQTLRLGIHTPDLVPISALQRRSAADVPAAAAPPPAKRQKAPPAGAAAPEEEAQGVRHYYLMKSEPDVFSIDDLAARPQQTEPWDGAPPRLLRGAASRSDGRPLM